MSSAKRRAERWAAWGTFQVSSEARASAREGASTAGVSGAGSGSSVAPGTGSASISATGASVGASVGASASTGASAGASAARSAISAGGPGAAALGTGVSGAATGGAGAGVGRVRSRRSASASEEDLMSMRQPVSLAARRAFWPSRPMASERWRSGTMTMAVPAWPEPLEGAWPEPGRGNEDVHDLGGAEGAGDEDGGIGGPLDDVDLLAVELVDDVLDTDAAEADAGADGVDALLEGVDGDLGAEAGLAGDGP